ncbi:MAG TPA: response regulator [Chthoniobacterales bacterium]|nr:response regulator [Chthoniobacterales bacterium]
MKILIVDDEPANLALLEALLTSSGYVNVKPVRDSRLVVDTCKSFEPDLILLDLMMPNLDGFGVLAGVRAEIADGFLPVVVLTADVTERTKMRALRASATDFLTKPFDHTEVLVRIANLLEMRRLHRFLDNQRAAFEDALRARTAELREVTSQMEELAMPCCATAIVR